MASSLRVGGTLTAADSRTIRVVPVEVPPGTRQLRVDLTYAPRAVEDRTVALDLVQGLLARLSPQPVPRANDMLARFWPLRNLLNIAVFDPRHRFRGRWDRNRPGHHSTAVLGERGSDPGMVDGAVVPGTWQLALEVHQILTPVEYSLTVEFLDEGPPGAPGGGASPRAGPSPQAAWSARGTAGERGEWLVGELHVHSEHSDGRQAVGDVARALRDAGVDFFALTDHNTTSGLRDLPSGILALPGFELTTFYGHATCLGITEVVPWYVGLRVRPLAEMAAQVHASGGLVAVAHPFSPPAPLCAGCRWEYPGFSWSDPDLLEIWNGDLDEHAPINAPALRLWDELLGAGRRMVAVAGSDLHDVEHLRTKRYARTLVRAQTRSAEGILQALRAGRAVVTAGPAVSLAASAGERTWAIGETAVLRRGDQLAVRGTVTQVPQAAEPVLVIGGKRLAQGHAFEHRFVVEGPTWVRMEVMVRGTAAAITNPIFVDVA